MKGIKIIVLMLMILSACNAGKKALKKGNKKYERGEYNVAINFYEKAVDKNTATAQSSFFIAESYRLSNRIKEAEPYYKKAIAEGLDNEAAQFYYGLSLKVNEKYKNAQQHLEQYLQSATDDQYRQLAMREVDNLRKINKLLDKESYFRVKNLELINSDAAEYGPVYSNGELYFTSSRYGGKIYKATGTAFTNIYKAQTQGAVVDSSTVEALNDMVNSPNTNDGCVTFSNQGMVMVFAKGNSGKKRGGKDVNLFITRFRRGEWSEPEKLSISDPNSWDSTPNFSSDGRTLYFASNRPGGFGGTDLYAATLDGRGRYGNVRNLGPTINTSGNEMFPHAAVDGKLYFSSTGHPGLGALDIFVAYREEGELIIENMGPSLNSSADDFGIYLYDPSKGFFCSNRENGKGDDDMYTFINNDPDLKIVNYYLAGTTVTVDDEGNEEILPNTRVRLVGANEEQLDEAVTDQQGRFLFRVYPEEDYILFGEKPDYLTSREDFSTIGKSLDKESLKDLITNKTFETKIQLDKIVLDKAIVLDNIYYDLDKAAIREDAARELDKLVAILDDNPEITIELSSHTDSRATDEYNMDLSQRRARSAVDYIITQGISAERLIAKGYGETQLLISEAEIEKLPTAEAKEEAHQKNRRTEFKILSYDKSKRLQKEQNTEGMSEEEILENTIDWDSKL
jgi:peptidoglycan-associated lipoprotein